MHHVQGCATDAGDMQYMYGYAVYAGICSICRDMQHMQGNAAYGGQFSVCKDMQCVHGICSVCMGYAVDAW